MAKAPPRVVLSGPAGDTYAVLKLRQTGTAKGNNMTQDRMTDTAAPRQPPGIRRLKAVLVLVAAASFVLSPLLLGGFGGYDPEAFPVPQLAPPIQPAGWAFGIWGLIYAWLLVHAIHGLVFRADAPDRDAGRWPLFASLGIGAGWIVAAQASPLWGTALIFAMLAGAVAALLRSPRGDRWFAQAPLAIYAGWLTAASWVSFGLLVGGYGLAGATGAALLALPLAVVMAVTVQLRLGRAPEYGLTVIWALLGVIAANWASHPAVVAMAVAGIAAVGAASLRAGRG